MKKQIYSEINQELTISEIESNVSQYWNDINLPQILKKISIRNERFVFLDGPPFANGMPHHGHILTGFIKDTFARFHTMLGKSVERSIGWDCHGLPVEMKSEKELQLSGSKQIKEYGIDKFNEYCKSSVLRCTDDWIKYMEKQGRLVDRQKEYKTMDMNYMESVIWAFKELYNKNLIYKSTRIMPYSWVCQTPVSDFETKIDNAYREKSSKAVTVAFEIDSKSASLLGFHDKIVKILAWTTTPWTLPSNLAIAINKNIDQFAKCLIPYKN